MEVVEDGVGRGVETETHLIAGELLHGDSIERLQLDDLEIVHVSFPIRHPRSQMADSRHFVIFAIYDTREPWLRDGDVVSVSEVFNDGDLPFPVRAIQGKVIPLGGCVCDGRDDIGLRTWPAKERKRP